MSSVQGPFCTDNICVYHLGILVGQKLDFMTSFWSLLKKITRFLVYRKILYPCKIFSLWLNLNPCNCFQFLIMPQFVWTLCSCLIILCAVINYVYILSPRQIDPLPNFHKRIYSQQLYSCTQLTYQIFHFFCIIPKYNFILDVYNFLLKRKFFRVGSRSVSLFFYFWFYLT